MLKVPSSARPRQEMAIPASVMTKITFQTESSAEIVGRGLGWKPEGGRPAVWCTERGYEKLALSHESWVSTNRKIESVVGLETALARCASPRCAGFSFRVRDAVATLYASARIADNIRFPLNKDRRLQWFYRKRPRIEGEEKPCSRLPINKEPSEWPSMPRRPPPIDRIVVSLSTTRGYPLETIESLKNQTLPPSEILVNRGRSGDEFGPATKLIPAIQKFFNDSRTLLVAVDDDAIYQPTLIEDLAHWATLLPVVSATGWPVKRSLDYPHWTENFLIFGNELEAPMPTSVVRGNCGFAVRPTHFDQALWTEITPSTPHNMDDVWFSGHLARRRIPRFVVPTRGISVSIPKSSTLDGRFDRMKENTRALRYFKGDWDVAWQTPGRRVAPF